MIDGAELGGTLDAMEKVPVDAKHRPLQDIRMQGVTIPEETLKSIKPLPFNPIELE